MALMRTPHQLGLSPATLGRLTIRGFHCLALAGGLLLGGCGGDDAKVTEPVVDRVDDAPHVAVDEMMAASDLAEGGTTADSLQPATDEPGKGALAAPAAVALGLPGRLDLAGVLRRLARRDLPALCSPAPRIDKLTSSASCALIGRDGEYVSELTLTFEGCRAPGIGSLDGTLRIHVAKTLADGATCDVAGIAVDVLHEAQSNLKLTAMDQSQLEVVGEGTTRFSVGRGKLALDRDVTVSQERTRLDPRGRAVSAQQLTGRAQSRVELGTKSVVQNGSFTATRRLAQIIDTATMTDVRRTRECCHPVGGQVVARHSRIGAGADGETTIGFGPECGQATADGVAVTLPACL
jgi:hypothetical protein